MSNPNPLPLPHLISQALTHARATSPARFPSDAAFARACIDDTHPKGLTPSALSRALTLPDLRTETLRLVLATAGLRVELVPVEAAPETPAPTKERKATKKGTKR